MSYFGRLPGYLLLAALYARQGESAQVIPPVPPVAEAPMTASEVAKTTGLSPLLQALQKEVGQPTNPNRELLLRQRILQNITSLSLEVDATAGQVDSEIAEIKELQNYLVVKRQRQINLLNLMGLAVGGGLGAAAGGLGLAGEIKAAGVVGVVAGGITSTLSVIGLRQSAGSAQTLRVESNMLANLFDRPASSNNYYPAIVSAFMKSIASNEQSGLTRNERLIHNWIQLHRLPEPNSSKDKDKILRMTSIPSEGVRLSIGDLDDRQAMLYDFRAKLLYLKRELARFFAEIPSSPQLVDLNLLP